MRWPWGTHPDAGLILSVIVTLAHQRLGLEGTTHKTVDSQIIVTWEANSQVTSIWKANVQVPTTWRANSQVIKIHKPECQLIQLEQLFSLAEYQSHLGSKEYKSLHLIVFDPRF